MKKPYLKKLGVTACINLFVFFTVFFFGPMEIYLGNVLEFDMPLSLVWKVLLVFAAVLTGVTAALESLLPKKVLTPINLLMLSGGICFYIQSMFLNGAMGSLTGETDVYPTSLVVTNLLIWLAVFVVVFALWLVLKKKKQEGSMLTGTQFVALALVVMQLVGFVTLFLGTDTGSTKKEYTYFSTDHQFELSPNKNVIYFIIDTCDGEYVAEALKEDPQLFDGFNGFTFFDNATTTHSRTFPSVPYMLSNVMCYFDKPYTQYVNDAFAEGDYIDRIDAQGTDIRLYTETNYLGESAWDKVDNFEEYENFNLSSLNLPGLLKQTLKVSGYRGLPYLLKPRFAYTADSVNLSSVNTPDNMALICDDLSFYHDIQVNHVTANPDFDSAFRFYHMYGSHPGAVVNENAEFEPGVTVAEATRGCLKIVETYINEMKESGLFDNTTIIITADHGKSGSSDDLRLHASASTLMMVKPMGKDDSEPMVVSHAPVAHADLFATVLDSLGADTTDYGRTIFDYAEDEQRDRYYYHTALYDDLDGEVALREYLVRGDAMDLESYHLTGKNWDVMYSQRAVSSHRLAESEKVSELGE